MNRCVRSSGLKPKRSYSPCASRVASRLAADAAHVGVVDDESDQRLAESAAALAGRTKTSASQANVARSVTTRAKPTCSSPR